MAGHQARPRPAPEDPPRPPMAHAHLGSGVLQEDEAVAPRQGGAEANGGVAAQLCVQGVYFEGQIMRNRALMPP